VAAAVLLGTGVAAAATSIPGANGQIQGCYNLATGVLRVVSDPTQCLTSSNPLVVKNPALLETPLAWSQAGPQGPVGPAGAPGSPGAPGASVVATPLQVGDTHCPTGGTQFSVGNGPASYACNGSAADVSALQTQVANLQATVTALDARVSALATTSGPTITGFTAGSAFVTDGGRTSLSATFSGTGATGVVDHNVGPITSGSPISITPPVDVATTYTLTVTDSGGQTATARVTVTTVPPPLIQSFVASPSSISLLAGQGAGLTATFSNGTGVIQGIGPVTSGQAIAVQPTTTTTYVLVVTNAAGTTAVSQTTVTVTL
jgi:hypothetical protein